MNYSFPSLFNYYTPEYKFLLDLNYSCPTDTSTTIIVPTICLLLQLSFTVFKRSSLSRTKVPHQVIRDLLSSKSFSSESAFRNSESLIPTTGYIYIFFHPECLRVHSHYGLLFFFFFSSLFGLLHIANGSICNVSGILCLGQIQINLDQTAHCHGSNFNVSSSPNQHSYQSDQFLSQWSNWSIPHHLDKRRIKRSKPYESCFLDKTSPLDPLSVPSHNYQQWQQQTTLQHCVAVCHLRVWSRITGGHSTGSPSPTPIFAMSILNSHFVFVHFAVSTVLFPLTVISNYLYIATPRLSLFSHLSFLSNYLQWYHLYSHIFQCIAFPFWYSISSNTNTNLPTTAQPLFLPLPLLSSTAPRPAAFSSSPSSIPTSFYGTGP